MTVHSQHRQVLTYLLLQKTILFLTFYEYLNRLFQNSNAHAVIQAGANTYQYDANGNMTQRPNQTITYDYDNRPTSINSTTFIYDYSGQRVKKNNTIYIGKHYECTNGTCTKYIFAGSSRIASKTSTATYYFHTDHLGSSSVITDAAGNKVEEIYYYPFGGTRLNQGTVNLKHKYTGQEEDPETGLYYYNARYYDPMLGRFISADSIVGNPRDPQDLNRYTYAGNNPLIYTDPSGHLKFKSLWKAVVSGIVGGAVFVLSGGTAAPVLSGMLAGMSAGATSAALNGGNLNQILKSAAIGGIIGGVTGGIYQALGTPATEALRNGVMYGMLAAGAVYATATDGLNGLAYYAGGVLGGYIGASGADYAMGDGSAAKESTVNDNTLEISSEKQHQKVQYDLSVDITTNSDKYINSPETMFAGPGAATPKSNPALWKFLESGTGQVVREAAEWCVSNPSCANFIQNWKPGGPGISDYMKAN